jgi:hypothetical protein
MAVAVEIVFTGGTLDQYDQVMDKMGLKPARVGPPSGLLFHWITATDDGIRVVDVWESAADFDAFAREKIVPITQEVGVPGPPDIRFHDVYNYLAG